MVNLYPPNTHPNFSLLHASLRFLGGHSLLTKHFFTPSSTGSPSFSRSIYSWSMDSLHRSLFTLSFHFPMHYFSIWFGHVVQGSSNFFHIDPLSKLKKFCDPLNQITIRIKVKTNKTENFNVSVS